MLWCDHSRKSYPESTAVVDIDISNTKAEVSNRQSDKDYISDYYAIALPGFQSDRHCQRQQPFSGLFSFR